jgi:hypothetical protein
MKATTLIRTIGAAAVAATALTIANAAAGAAAVTTTQAVTITSRTVVDARTADGNSLLQLHVCGTASLGNGGAYDWCQDEKLVIHPQGDWTFNAQGRLSGSFPSCGDVSSDYDMNGHGPTTSGGLLVGLFRAGSIDSANGTGGFHFQSGGDLTPAVANSTITYAC